MITVGGIQFGQLSTRFLHKSERKNGEKFCVLRDYVIKYGDFKLRAPKGTKTDGASIPRFFWRLIGPPLHADYAPAAVIHDAAYEGTLLWTEKGVVQLFTREEADDLFLFLMEKLGIPPWRRKMMFRAVRWFGKKAWDNNRKNA
tara:strand:+ start:4695 stop:5126 length:432 start_codon:yes stop_codon:yes gene_type:complete